MKQVNPDGSITLLLGGGIYTVEDATGNPEVTKYYSIAGQRVAMNGPDGLQFLLTDHLGSVIGVLDDVGNLLSEQRYLPFGEPRFAPGISETDFGFTGQRDLAAIGLMDYNARFYSAGLGRFTQADSIVAQMFTPPGLNRYSYVGNNPTNFIDPSGHALCASLDGSCTASYVQPTSGANPLTTSRIKPKLRFCQRRPEKCNTGGIQPTLAGPAAPAPVATLVDEPRSTGGLIIETTDAIDDYLRYKPLNFRTTGGLVTIYGPRSARSYAGLNPFTNRIGGYRFITEQSLSSLKSPFLLVGILFSAGMNVADYEAGIIDEYELAAALFWDTAANVGSAALAGAAFGTVAAGPLGTVGGVLIGFGVAVLANVVYNEIGRDELIAATSNLLRESSGYNYNFVPQSAPAFNYLTNY